MKIFTSSTSRPSAPRRGQQAWTLVEMIVSMSVFSFVTMAFIGLQMFGMKQSQLVESKLGASDQSRFLFEKMGWEIRSAKRWEIGNVSGTSFTEIADGQPQRGTGIRLFMNPDRAVTNQFIQYYFNTTSRSLWRSLNGFTGAELICADLTNNMAFQAEDFRGGVQTAGSGVWKNCIRVIVEFAQYQYPLTQVGPGRRYDYYKMEFRATPHSPTL